ncbi:DNA-binding transcriptional regulator Cro [uncultured Caudovirales phage]|uniref:DNA-binding transcriptional regulator Cro n=1 Tax=uncultured Caudovirales phage TaxID=2100421 RepID=A0A6J7X444_9CAUD|nr:DNA-binding transcriptional regulator Cro [uncultured Caudovirales phage]CAB4157734.1 DNA-binding transcriptional regulator Cro [uncultured Caudovirales phage]CAB5225308.1 DNA-binding transcriptional regulator Cro [uncultured Caudovirales phage]
MTPNDVKKYYGNSYQFKKKTKMSDASFRNWMKWGFVPENSQYKLERLTNGCLKAEWSNNE